MLNLKSQSSSPNSKFFEQVYNVVKQIPEGKVTTYGQISFWLRSGITGSEIDVSPQFVGWALHANKDPETVPCHRVVNKDGGLAPSYAFGGPGQQKVRLFMEGVTFIDETHVDLKKHFWKG
jgi:methylated-DNA-protein-cysteine methyltransferase-like protein